MDQVIRDQVKRATQYREFLEKAAQLAVVPAVQPTLPDPIQSSFFFPWEYSPYRANGTTSAESNSAK